MFRLKHLILIPALLFTVCANAQSPCHSKERQAFDFWLGSWTVYSANGKLAGKNRIEKRHGGCVVHEHYTTNRGYSGESINVYDASRGVWHQSWVDSSGLLLELEGKPQNGKMVLEGHTPDKSGKQIKQRITWTPEKDGTVRQLWQARTDGNAWKTVFDGRYVKESVKGK